MQDTDCRSSTVTEALRQNTEWHAGMGFGFGTTAKVAFGTLHVEAFHAYGGRGGNFAGRSWTYVSGGGPAVELKVGTLRLGFSFGGGETRFGNYRFEELRDEPFFLWDWAESDFGKFGDRGHIALADLGLETDLPEVAGDTKCH
jgi:hypothetical protein